ncbi:hypothetical protein Ccrd_017553, partial [Cynara cardunculus var. scolymus]
VDRFSFRFLWYRHHLLDHHLAAKPYRIFRLFNVRIAKPLRQAMEATATEVTVGEPPKIPMELPFPARKPVNELSVEEMVAKSIVPVKKEFMCPAPNRLTSDNNGPSGDAVPVPTTASAPVIKEKKSKRQLKRERIQEKQSTRNLCPMVAKTGKADSCPYNDKCRFSHDIEAFKDQKPADLEGICPFEGDEGPCPYGLACRYLGTHKTDVALGTPNARKNAEVNGLKKDVQRLLWKNKMKFPKADATLKVLGLMGAAKSKKTPEADNGEENQTVSNGSNVTNGNGCGETGTQPIVENECCPEVPEKVEDSNGADDPRPLKKGKSLTDETLTEKDLDASGAQLESLSTVGHIETDKSLNLRPREKKLIDFRDKLYLAPLTTVGNLPFRRVCKVLGADITCGEMAMCTNLLQARTSYFEGRSRIDSVIADIGKWGANAATIHGRSRQQRYIKQADWEYIYQCTRKAPDTFQVLGNGDIFTFSDWKKHKSDCPELSSCMIARGALVKPWLFTEIKEQRDWDISSGERLNILKDYVRFGLEHWGSDTKGVETVRHFLLEWLSYTYRYVPLGLLEIRISEMLLGKVPDGFTFSPKHKSNAFDKAENG